MTKDFREELIQRIQALSPELIPQSTGVEPQSPVINNIRCVLFDVYGTLLVSGSGDIDSMQDVPREIHFEKALETVGIRHRDGCGNEAIPYMIQAVKDHHQSLKDKGVVRPEVEIRDIWRRVFDKMIQEGSLMNNGIPDKKIERFAVEYEMRVNPVCPMPDAVATVQELSGRFATGIVSNAQFYTPLTLTAFCDDWGFRPALCVWSYREQRAKPDDKIFSPVIRELRKTGIEPSQTVYVGNDMLNDVATAAAQGCRTILFAGDKRSLRLRDDQFRLKSLKPDAVITELIQLLQIIRD